MKLKSFKSVQRTLASTLLLFSVMTGNAVKALQEDTIATKSLSTNNLVAVAKENGKFKVQHYPIENSAYKKIEFILKESQAFEELAKGLNETLAMPNDVTIKLGECGEANAYYAPSTHEIVMCYELMEAFADNFFKHVDTEEELYKKVIFATLFVFMHEMGHALIGELDLPTTGKEEDAVDQLATIIMTLAGDEGGEIALAAAKQFELAGSKQTDIQKLPFWDEHSLDQQRYYGIVCLLYGSNAEKYTFLAQQAGLPESRAQRCEAEYVKTAISWMKLLEPYVREEQKI
ncbi:MAG: DUF4344 domain-containing metallopeptidase [Aphanothece sp. CMT-3BRIN-NPC111]|jgi:hypothetical protein|nr:DUF4344 domain-containing metallopeptidase [Aphanothece sp. CMT-3BRIN-NPC111]